MNNYYAIKCQLHNHKGPSFVINIMYINGIAVLRKQEKSVQPNERLYIQGRVDNSKEYKEVTLHRSVYNDLIEMFDHAKVNLIPPLTGGFDGITYKIWLVNGQSEVYFSWWLDCPKKWGALNNIWEKIVELSDT